MPITEPRSIATLQPKTIFEEMSTTLKNETLLSQEEQLHITETLLRTLEENPEKATRLHPWTIQLRRTTSVGEFEISLTHGFKGKGHHAEWSDPFAAKLALSQNGQSIFHVTEYRSESDRGPIEDTWYKLKKIVKE